MGGRPWQGWSGVWRHQYSLPRASKLLFIWVRVWMRVAGNTRGSLDSLETLGVRRGRGGEGQSLQTKLPLKPRRSVTIQREEHSGQGETAAGGRVVAGRVVAAIMWGRYNCAQRRSLGREREGVNELLMQEWCYN